MLKYRGIILNINEAHQKKTRYFKLPLFEEKAYNIIKHNCCFYHIIYTTTHVQQQLARSLAQIYSIFMYTNGMQRKTPYTYIHRYLYIMEKLIFRADIWHYIQFQYHIITLYTQTIWKYLKESFRLENSLGDVFTTRQLSRHWLMVCFTCLFCQTK